MNIKNFIQKNKFTQKQIDSINIIINECKYYNIVDDRHIAYILATTKHETANTFLPIKEYGGPLYFIKRYWLNSRIAKWLGNDDSKDAVKYAGAGFVQITGEDNYEKFTKILGVDLKNKPELALNPVIAAKIMVYGMKYGTFTGVSLSTYFNRHSTLPVSARRIINGVDRAELIASYYNVILNQLRAI